MFNFFILIVVIWYFLRVPQGQIFLLRPLESDQVESHFPSTKRITTSFLYCSGKEPCVLHLKYCVSAKSVLLCLALYLRQHLDHKTCLFTLLQKWNWRKGIIECLTLLVAFVGWLSASQGLLHDLLSFCSLFSHLNWYAWSLKNFLSAFLVPTIFLVWVYFFYVYPKLPLVSVYRTLGKCERWFW